MEMEMEGRMDKWNEGNGMDGRWTDAGMGWEGMDGMEGWKEGMEWNGMEWNGMDGMIGME